MLEHLIPSKARRKILGLFFKNVQESYYLRQVVREVNEEVNAVKRELDILSEAKMLLKEPRLNKVFYSLNKNFIFFDEFLRIYAKMSPLYEELMKQHSKMGKVKFLAVGKHIFKNEAIKSGDISILFVGVIVMPEVEALMERVEKEQGREVHYTVMNDEEFAFRKRSNDPFVWRFLKQPKIMFIGQEEELVK